MQSRQKGLNFFLLGGVLTTTTTTRDDEEAGMMPLLKANKTAAVAALNTAPHPHRPRTRGGTLGKAHASPDVGGTEKRKGLIGGDDRE